MTGKKDRWKKGKAVQDGENVQNAYFGVDEGKFIEIGTNDVPSKYLENAEVIDAEGNLIGINFDRSWESTMSAFMFDDSRCRNIAVYIRYVLWVIDKYGDDTHLVKEMNIIK